jgi:hypothetical protein
MNRQQFEDLLGDLAAGWQHRRYSEIIDRFAPDVLYVDPLRYRFTDREALLAFFSADAGADQEVGYHHVLFDEDRQVGMVEYTYRGSFIYHGVAVVKIVDGLIREWREFQHTTDQVLREPLANHPPQPTNTGGTV